MKVEFNKKNWNEFHIINKTIKNEKAAIKNRKWAQFINNIGENPLSSKAIWNRIQIIKNNCTKNKDSYPILIHENEKDKYDESFKSKVERDMKEFYKNAKRINSVKTINIKNLDKTKIKNF